MKKTIFTGSATALVTPICDKGINFDAFEKIIDIQIKSGTDALVVCGTTGEAPTLEDREHLEAIECAVSCAGGKIPVIAGTGSNNTAHAVMMNKEAQKLGADGVLWVAPYYNKSTQRGLVKHYETLALSTDLPAILYNVPSRTGSDIKPETVEILSKVENIVAIKEATGDLSRTVEIISRCGDNIDVYSGNDDIIVPMLSIGSCGVISVLSNILPKETHDMCKYYEQGEISKSTYLQLHYLDLIQKLFIEVNPIPIKEAMNLLGFEVGDTRLPLTNMSKKNIDLLYSSLKNVFGI